MPAVSKIMPYVVKQMQTCSCLLFQLEFVGGNPQCSVEPMSFDMKVCIKKLLSSAHCDKFFCVIYNDVQ
jgi:hypothetical protein